MIDATPTIDIQGLEVSLGGTKLLRDVSFSAAPGQVTGLIGHNGAGKSTLLAAAAGDLPRAAGTVTIAGHDPANTSPLAMARLRAVMLQDVTVSFQFLVRDVVAFGRRPWAGTAREELDDAIVDAALAAADVAHLAGRDIATLSGGERARVALARVIAQQTPAMFLDEPTAALDIRHQEVVLRLVRTIAREANVAVVVVLHDLNAAAAYCDHIVCLSGGTVAAAGPVPAVYTEEILSDVYDWPVSVARTDGAITVHPARRPDSAAATGFIDLIRTHP